MKINNSWYEDNANTWWQPNSSLSLLQALNPGRFAYLDRVLRNRGTSYQNLKILDIGCGGGFICEEFAERGADVTGLDPSASTLQVATAHAHKMGYQITYQQGSAEKLPFADNQFDLVSCCDVLEHVDDLSLAIKETARVLKPGGIYFYDTINRTFLSWLILIKMVQDWPVTRFLPENTHVWRMFIKPEELLHQLNQHQLQHRDMTGLGAPLRIMNLKYFIDARRGLLDAKALGEKIGMGSIGSQKLTYMGWAVK